VPGGGIPVCPCSVSIFPPASCFFVLLSPFPVSIQHKSSKKKKCKIHKNAKKNSKIVTKNTKFVPVECFVFYNKPSLRVSSLLHFWLLSFLSARLLVCSVDIFVGARASLVHVLAEESDLGVPCSSSRSQFVLYSSLAPSLTRVLQGLSSDRRTAPPRIY
jgi:hypothetical protein